MQPRRPHPQADFSMGGQPQARRSPRVSDEAVIIMSDPRIKQGHDMVTAVVTGVNPPETIPAGPGYESPSMGQEVPVREQLTTLFPLNGPEMEHAEMMRRDAILKEQLAARLGR